MDTRDVTRIQGLVNVSLPIINGLEIHLVKNDSSSLVKYDVITVTYSYDFKLSRQHSPTKFIPEFLESVGCEIKEPRLGQKFKHLANASFLEAVLDKGEHIPAIDVYLNMDGRSKISYFSTDLNHLPVANELVMRMVETYKK